MIQKISSNFLTQTSAIFALCTEVFFFVVMLILFNYFLTIFQFPAGAN